MAYDKGNKADSPMKRRGGRRRKKVCVFCGKENNEIDYKDVAKLRKYVSERGKNLRKEVLVSFFVYLSKAGEKEAPLQFGVKVHFV